MTQKHEVVPFSYNGMPLSAITGSDGEPWFIAKDVSGILEYSDAHEMCSRIDEDDKQNRQIPGFGNRGVIVINESGLYTAILGSTKPEAKPFKKWITSEVLPSIRKTGSYSETKVTPALPTTSAPHDLFPAYYNICLLIGLDKNVAAISANQATKTLTGTNVLALIGHTHLETPKQVLYFTPTDLGLRMSLSGRKFNMLLAEAGLQVKIGDDWKPLPTAEGFYRILDTGKRHSSGIMIQQIKWSDNVIDLLKKAA